MEFFTIKSDMFGLKNFAPELFALKLNNVM